MEPSNPDGPQEDDLPNVALAEHQLVQYETRTLALNP